MSSALPTSSVPSSRTSRSGSAVEIPEGLETDPLVRMTVILARGEADKWKKRIETQGHIEPENEGGKANLQVMKLVS